jgi:hypothetical protein
MPSEGAVLMEEWARPHEDLHLSGVFADWLEENRDSDLLVGATGPSDPAARLDALIQYLRDRFHLQSS